MHSDLLSLCTWHTLAARSVEFQAATGADQNQLCEQREWFPSSTAGRLFPARQEKVPHKSAFFESVASSITFFHCQEADRELPTEEHGGDLDVQPYCCSSSSSPADIHPRGTAWGSQDLLRASQRNLPSHAELWCSPLADTCMNDGLL